MSAFSVVIQFDVFKNLGVGIFKAIKGPFFHQFSNVYTLTVTDWQGRTSVWAFEVKYTSGLDEAESVTQLLIYPNPTAHLANLELNSLKTLSPAWLDLFDAAGRKIKSFNILQKTGDFTWQIPLDVLASGCYLLCLRNKTGEIIGLGRFVKH